VDFGRTEFDKIELEPLFGATDFVVEQKLVERTLVEQTLVEQIW
jgi:hypothetical protein